MTAPPFAYYGSKVSLADRIAELLPAHGHYVEPFAGSLAVLLAKPRSGMETVNDLDQYLMTFWRMLRDRPAELERVMDLTPHSRAEYESAYDYDVADDLERARRVWVLLSQGRGGALRRTGWRFYRNPAGSAYGMPDLLAAYVSRASSCADRLHGVSLECRPALDVIRAYGQHPDVLIYADPPYLSSTRSRSWDSRYQHELRTDDEHIELADALRACRCAVVLSGYDSPLYDKLYAGWDVRRITCQTGNGGEHRDRTEVLWSNRPLGQPDLFSGPS